MEHVTNLDTFHNVMDAPSLRRLLMVLPRVKMLRYEKSALLMSGGPQFGPMEAFDTIMELSPNIRDFALWLRDEGPTGL